MLPGVQAQLERLKEEYPDAEVSTRADGTVHIEVSGVPIATGWNKDRICILIVLPIGYPQAPPSGFQADNNLRLTGGKQPDGSDEQCIDGQTWLHFCWSPQNWDYNRESLWKFLKFCQSRFEERR